MIQNMVQRPHHGLPEWPSNTPKSDTTAFLQLAPSRIARMQKIEYKSRILGVGRDAQCAVVMWLVQSKIKVGHAKQIAIGSHGNACICMGIYTYACVNQKHNVRNVYVIAKYREYIYVSILLGCMIKWPAYSFHWNSSSDNHSVLQIAIGITYHWPSSTTPARACHASHARPSILVSSIWALPTPFSWSKKGSEPKKHSSHSESCWSFKRPCNKLVNNM